MNLVLRKPDANKEECLVAAFRVKQSDLTDYTISMLNSVVPNEVCRIGLKIFPAGFVIDAFFFEENDSDEDEELDEVYYTDIKVLH